MPPSSPTAGRYDFVLEQGTTFRRQIGVPLNLTGYSARMQIKPRVGAEPLVTLTSELGGGLTVRLVTVDPPLSAIDLVVTPAQSRAIPVDRAAGGRAGRGVSYWHVFVYDLKLIGPDEIRLLEGQVSLSPEVTSG